MALRAATRADAPAILSINRDGVPGVSALGRSDIERFLVLSPFFRVAERSGVLRWMFRHDNRVHWYGSREEAAAAMVERELKPLPKSGTTTTSKFSTFVRSQPQTFSSTWGGIGCSLPK